jgi:hypothetical protein
VLRKLKVIAIDVREDDINPPTNEIQATALIKRKGVKLGSVWCAGINELSVLQDSPSVDFEGVDPIGGPPVGILLLCDHEQAPTRAIDYGCARYSYG